MIITNENAAPPHVPARPGHNPGAASARLDDRGLLAQSALPRSRRSGSATCTRRTASSAAHDKSPRPFMWTPKTVGANFEFSPTMKALEPFREHLNVFSGLAQVTGRALGDGPGDHARATATWLTGVHPYKTGGANFKLGISADQIAAKELGKHTQLASLELGLEPQPLAGNCDSGYTCAYMSMSWRGGDDARCRPRSIRDGVRAAVRRRREHRSPPRAWPGSRTEERPRLRHRQPLAAAAAARHRRQAQARRIPRSRARHRAPHSARRRAERHDEAAAHGAAERDSRSLRGVRKLMMDLQVIAWQTDMTRVTSFMMGRDGSNRAYREIGISDGHHSISHHQNDPEQVEKLIKIDELHTAMFAYLLKRLQETPDGDGTLLDHSLVVFGSSLSESNIHTHDDLPIVLAGNAAAR